MRIDYGSQSGAVALPPGEPVQLGQGHTPLSPLDLPVDEASGRFWLKHEWQNPTGSHKDRFSAFAVSRAMEVGAGRIAAASSGNAGISLAAYAAHVGIGCDVAIDSSVPAPIVDTLRRLGATVHTFLNAQDRWQWLAGLEDDRDTFIATNFLTPPVGSSAWGIEGYKLIALELVQQLEAVPDWIVVPTSRGDLAWGVLAGFRDLGGRVPRMVLVEPFPRIRPALLAADYRLTFPGETAAMRSIAGNTVTYQALECVRSTGGLAVEVSDADALDWQRWAWTHGYVLEASSCAAFSAAAEISRQRLFSAEDRVVLLATSQGFTQV